MDTKKLRQKILDLAIRGKLVPQDPNDEPASVLLERIRAEKERLIQEGKLKKKDLEEKPINDDEKLFDIPDSWEWVRIGTYTNKVTDFVASGSFASLRENVKYYNNKEYAILVRTKDFQTNFKSDLVYTDKHGYDFLENSNLFGGELILPNIGASIGKVFIVPRLNYRMTLAPNAVMIRFIDDYQRDWVYILFLSEFGKSLLCGISSSTAQGKFNKTDFKNLVIPIPPSFERKRIINEVERWFTLIDELESNEGDLLKAIDNAKSKILDLAIHGKLVPQDPNDEPAIELLKRINPKFEASDETPWELPNNWCWTTLGNISNYGKCIHVEANDIPNNAWVLELEDLEKDTAKLLQRVTCTERDIKGVRSVFRKGDVLFSKLRTYLNKVLVAPEDGYCSTEIVPISLCDSLSSHYINHVLRSKYFVEYTTSCGYGVKMPRLSTTDACKGLIPLPPKTEQLRIVAKIEELFAVLDSIKQSLEA